MYVQQDIHRTSESLNYLNSDLPFLCKKKIKKGLTLTPFLNIFRLQAISSTVTDYCRVRIFNKLKWKSFLPHKYIMSK